MLRSFRLLARLPLGLLQALGAGLGLLVYLVSPAYRRKLLRNLEIAGLPRELRWSCARHAGRMVGELPWIWFRPRAALTRRVRCDDQPVLEAAEREGRGVLFMTPHLGAFEVAARWYATRAPITVLFKPPRQAALAQVLAAARNADDMQSAPTTLAGVRALLRALRRGEAVGLLPDQVPGEGEGQWAPFFGAPAWTMTLPLRLAQASGAVVVLAVGERLGAGKGWHIHFERLAGAPTPEALNAAMERCILRIPAQYLWGYNRYKRPPGAGEPPGGAAP
ncbi:lysophospholipid acyltransferase family protein [Quisquiliibacterium transsilvanicum]|uniref:KDO2-lipid IV(A) lauroyltransferase n=1 Tax=Quisquiliibacterium transsilvanicum TaxID=1549638 RepID=A0A7W8MAA8_9BURK|nr:lysophospholipid acyltransferase family protein [Quisquiliibacterium transsilvanicum]MBB5273190.1 KDO2-lipid IV(A) lauroyltransferase [Quisquiliibacterium transsilvanicum]